MKCSCFVVVLVGVLLATVRVEGRTWTDSTGKFSIEAEFVEVDDGKVVLKKANGRRTVVPLDRLSQADRKYVASQTKEYVASQTKEAEKLEVDVSIGWVKTTVHGEDGKPEPRLMEGRLELIGKAAKEAHRWGFLKIDTITDDQGKSLKVAEKMPFGFDEPAKQYIEINRKDDFFHKHPDEGLLVPIPIEHAKSPLKKIAKLTGSLKLLTGARREEILVEKVMTHLDKPLKDGLLKEMPFQVTVKKSKYEEATLTISVQGDSVEFGSVEAINPKGKPYDNVGNGWSTSGNQREFYFTFEKAIPSDVRVKITLLLDAKEVDVPFSFSNLEIPPEPTE